MVVSIGGKHHSLWRAANSEGEVLDVLVQSRRDKKAALRLMRKLLRRQGLAPTVLVTDKLRSYGAVLKEVGAADRQETGRRLDNGSDNSHLPFRPRERAAKMTATRIDPRHSRNPLQNRSRPQ